MTERRLVGSDGSALDFAIVATLADIEAEDDADKAQRLEEFWFRRALRLTGRREHLSTVEAVAPELQREHLLVGSQVVRIVDRLT